MKLGLKITKPLKDGPHRTRWPNMAEEKKDEGVGDHIKSLLEEALVRQRDEMMNKFSQILRRLQVTVDTSTSSGHFGGMAPFRV